MRIYLNFKLSLFEYNMLQVRYWLLIKTPLQNKIVPLDFESIRIYIFFMFVFFIYKNKIYVPIMPLIKKCSVKKKNRIISAPF